MLESLIYSKRKGPRNARALILKVLLQPEVTRFEGIPRDDGGEHPDDTESGEDEA